MYYVYVVYMVGTNGVHVQYCMHNVDYTIVHLRIRTALHVAQLLLLHTLLY